MPKNAPVRETLALLKEHYPDAHCALNYRNPFELLVATALSAQCTDKRVNLVTPALFAAYPDSRTLSRADQEAVETLIHSTGFYRNKAKNLIAAAQRMVEVHDGDVPATLDELNALPGVGRKTANVILGNAFGIPGMVVDTHVKRISYRLGWTKETDPVRIESDLCKKLPAQDWTLAGHLLIDHGRAICKAPTPICSACFLAPLCPQCGVTKAK